MKKLSIAIGLLIVSALLVRAAPAEKPAKQTGTLVQLQATSLDAARSSALAWLKEVGKDDIAVLSKFQSLWNGNRTLVDKVAGTIVLADPQAAELLAEARDNNCPAPTELPKLLQDTRKPVFYRANLVLAYAKALSTRRVYEESLAALKLIKPTQVVDPAAYLFTRAVAEHALMMKDAATHSIQGILEDVPSAPERYKMVSLLMLYDMESWRDKDLGSIARKMDNIERRLELARGGPHTQKIEKEVVARLDELIKKLESQAKGGANGGSCPGSDPSGSGGNGQGSPMHDSQIATLPGQGVVSPKKLAKLAEAWGKLPEKERAKQLRELTRDLPPQHRDLIERYFKQIAEGRSTVP